MDRALHSDRQRWLCDQLRAWRVTAGLRQTDVAARLGVPQSFVSKYESGERRLDLIELAQICLALDHRLNDIAEAYTARWGTADG